MKDFKREAGKGREGEGQTAWRDVSWMLSLPSTFLIALLAPVSRVLAVVSPSLVGELGVMFLGVLGNLMGLEEDK